ncbi:GM24508 [Drosophila sechellia]|uniref:GM24508 n=2 Tax=Drosophila sechellia TaxID=7238 RepID=B4HI39_DROSE|nr:GM24508 [Drosophila sechellia]
MANLCQLKVVASLENMRLFVALVCVSLVAVSSAQLSLRGRLGRSAKVDLSVEPPTLLAKAAGIVPTVLVKNAGIVPTVLVKNAAQILPAVNVAADVETPSILPQVSNNILPYYPRYWPDYGSFGYPGDWNGPSYWDNNYYDYGAPYLRRRRLVKPVLSPAVISAPTNSDSSSTTTTTTTVSGEDSPAVTTDVVPDQADASENQIAEPVFTTQVI